MKFNRSPLLAILIAFVMVSSHALPADAACLSDSEARLAITAGEALRLGDLAGALPGEVVGVMLCKDKGKLVYRLGVMMGNGKIQKLQLDAQSGRVLK
jgi:uncharacterized membrane protein YkoI